MLRAAGHVVHVETVSNDAISTVAAKTRAFWNAPHDLARVEWMKRLIRQYETQLVHVHNFFPLMTPAVHEAASSSGVAVVQTLHNYRLICSGALFLREGQVCEKCLDGSKAWGVVHRCYRKSVAGSLAVAHMQLRAERHRTWHRHVQQFIALTNFAKEKFVAGGLPPSRIAVKGNFVPDTVYNRDPEARRGALFVGRLSPEKGTDTLISAWSQMTDVPLTVAGHGPDEARLRAIAPPTVRFLGQLTADAVRDEMAKAQCLVVPSIWYEGFPMTVLEGFASGLPVLASHIGSLAEIVVDGVNGAHFEPGNPLSLKQVATNLFADPRRLDRLGQGARDTYQNNFTPSANLVQLERIYESALRELSLIQ